MADKTVGLALGGGGAKGLAHLAVLETLDEMGIRPSAIAGTSIGAIIGALYATGRPAAELSAAISRVLATPRSFQELRQSKRLFGWIDLLGIDLGRNHLLEAEGFVEALEMYLGVQTFEELDIPLKVVAADFWRREEVVFDSGPLLPAIEASFCLPGVFQPVILDGRLLIDGGSVNPVPFDLLRHECDIVIAVDVLGQRTPEEDLMPGMFDILFNTFQIAERSIAVQKYRMAQPDILIDMPINDVRALEFQKYETIREQARPECERLSKELTHLLSM